MKKIFIVSILIIEILFLMHYNAKPLAAIKENDSTFGSFYSESLGTEKNYRIFLPPSYNKEPDRRFPVLYLLHGYNFARNDPNRFLPNEEENHWMEQEKLEPIAYCCMTVSSYSDLESCLREKKLQLPRAPLKEKEEEESASATEIAIKGIIDALKHEYPNPLSLPISEENDKPPLPPHNLKGGFVEEMIIVMPDGDNSFYVNRRDGKKQWPPLDGEEFVNGIRKGATGMYEDYIVKDLVKHIDETYRTIPDRRARFIGGFSMGGIGSMSLALKHQDVFSSVSALSLVFNFSQLILNPLMYSFSAGTPEVMELFIIPNDPKKRIDKEYLKTFDAYEIAKSLNEINLRIYFDAGDKDFFSGMSDFKSYKDFAQLLDSKGVKHYPKNHIIKGTEFNGGGLHTARYWLTRLPVILKFHSDSYNLNK